MKCFMKTSNKIGKKKRILITKRNELFHNYILVCHAVLCLVTSVQISSVQSLSYIRLLSTPWIPAHWALLSITISRSSLKLMSIELMMPSSHLILWRPLLLLPPIPPSIRVFSNESTLPMRLCPTFHNPMD